MKKHTNPSLEQVHGSVDTTRKHGYWRKLLAFMGPAYLVSVGYMDPGNWATDIAGGSQFGYKLLWVLLMSNLMAILLQSLSARLGLVRGLDLAQASREAYPKAVNFFLYILAEIAIAACDLAEVLGMAIGLQLLFGLPLIWGVALTVLDTFLLLLLINHGMRAMEAFILALIGVIGAAFLVEIFFVKPDIGELVTGFIPSLPGNRALYIAIGIIGATVMPHNLYLHSSLVQTRKFDRVGNGIRDAIKFNIIDSSIALNMSFFVNAAILVLAASAFFRSGMYEVSEIKDAHHFLEPIMGNKLAPILFAVALIAAGQSSTLTGTLAGQIVMEGYLNLRIQPWIRRVITRVVAITPALFTIIVFGEGKTGELLILSQVVLSLQLGFAVIPLIHFVSDAKKMGQFKIKKYVQLLTWLIALVIVSLNVKLVIDEITGWFHSISNPMIIWITVVPVAFGSGLLLLYIAIKPFIATPAKKKLPSPHGILSDLMPFTPPSFTKIAIAVDFSIIDNKVIHYAMAMGNKDAEYLLVHVVETAGAMMMGQEIVDNETFVDQESLNTYTGYFKEKGFAASSKLGYGNPKKGIPDIVNDYGADLLVMGAHGHNMIKDLLLGTTVDTVRHKVKIPVMIVKD